MRKIPCVFQRDFGDRRNPKILPAVTPGCEWVLAGDGVPTRKRDGTACFIRYGTIKSDYYPAQDLLKRYDAKRGKQPPPGFEPAQEPDPVTGHWPGWLPVDVNNPAPEDVWHALAWWKMWARRLAGDGPLGVTHADLICQIVAERGQVTAELCGPRINGNHERFGTYYLSPHGQEVVPMPGGTTIYSRERTFDGLKTFLETFDGEGIVFWREAGNPDGDMAKLTRENFGFSWPPVKP